MKKQIPVTLVIGDSIIDKYYFLKYRNKLEGTSIFNYMYNHTYPGGAANVVNHFLKNGENVIFITLDNIDPNLIKVKNLFNKFTSNSSQLQFFNLYHKLKMFMDFKVPIKFRLINKTTNKKLLRYDIEKSNFLVKNAAYSIIYEIENIIENILLNEKYKITNCIISDYNKGLLNPTIINYIITYLKKNNIDVIIDPKNYKLEYLKHCKIIKLNENEFKQLKKINKIRIFSNFYEKFSNNKISYVIVTRGSKSVLLYDIFNKKCFKFSVPKKHKIKDVSGAGDAFIFKLVSELNKNKTFIFTGIEKAIDYAYNSTLKVGTI